MSNKVFTVKNSEDLSSHLFGLFEQNKKGATVIFLSGDLGAGKTTFVQSFSKTLDVKSRVLSPTFNILKEHSIEAVEKGFRKMVHIDLYRIEHVGHRELESFGVNEYLLDSSVIMFVEWPERIEENVLTPNYWVNILIQNDGSRQITIKEYES